LPGPPVPAKQAGDFGPADRAKKSARPDEAPVLQLDDDKAPQSMVIKEKVEEELPIADE